MSYYTKDRKLKSCTSCSQKEGRHVLHPVDEFGKDKRKAERSAHAIEMNGDTDWNNSCCTPCRWQMRKLRLEGVNATTHTLQERLVMIESYETLWTQCCEDGIYWELVT